MPETPHPSPEDPELPTLDVLRRRADVFHTAYSGDAVYDASRSRRLTEHEIIFDAVVNGEISPIDAAAITATHQAAAEYQNAIDARTGLYNGTVIEGRLRKALVNAAQTSSPVSVAFIDLDDFGKVNKEYSQEYGDAILEQVGEFFGRYTRSSDDAGRIGGEELLVVMQGINESDMKKRITPLIEELPHYVESSLEGTGFSVAQKITASVGIAQVVFNHPHPAGTTIDGAASSLINLANRRMRLAKEAGKRRIVGTFDEPTIRRGVYRNGLTVQSRNVL